MGKQLACVYCVSNGVNCANVGARAKKVEEGQGERTFAMQALKRNPKINVHL